MNFSFFFVFIFVIWGPFVESDRRLNTALIDDKGKKKGGGTRVQGRRKGLEGKSDNTADTSSVRGLSMDQRIKIEKWVLGIR